MRSAVIRDLVAFEPAGRRTNLAASLSYTSRLLRHRSIVVILSDFIAEGWERPLRRLAARHEVVAITVDDPREHDLPDSGWIEMLDAESGRRILVDTGSRQVRERVGRLAQQRREERGRALTAAGADQVRLDTGAAYALPLRRAFARRAQADSPQMIAAACAAFCSSRRAHGGRHASGSHARWSCRRANAACRRTGTPTTRSNCWARLD